MSKEWKRWGGGGDEFETYVRSTLNSLCQDIKEIKESQAKVENETAEERCVEQQERDKDGRYVNVQVKRLVIYSMQTAELTVLKMFIETSWYS